ncbi:MAG: DMT family transporter [Arenibacterium sp.]
MSRTEITLFSALLMLAGAGWGLTQPLSKIAVSTGYQHFGLIFWQMVIGALAMALIALATGRRLPLNRVTIRFYAFIALIGTIIPNGASYQALVHIPAGFQSVLMSLVPMAALPIALAFGLERASVRRLFGLLAGLGGVMLLTLPRASVPDPAMLPWMMLTLLAVFCYAFEGNYVAKWGTRGLDAIQVLLGASLIGIFLALPLAVMSGQFISPFRPYGAPEWSLIASALIHVMVYAIYVWMVGRAGPVFTAQVGYLVTGFGVVWAMLILRESYSPYFWAAMALIFLGVFLVQPRGKDKLAPARPIDDTSPK